MIPLAQASLQALRTRAAEQRGQAIQAYRRHLRPEPLLKALSRQADATVRALLRGYPLPEGACLAAVGGYGRGEMYPASDLDLLILLARAPTTQDTSRIEALIAALWDVGLEPGHSVRTCAQCLIEAAQDITVQTALLEARWLAGAKPLFDHFQMQMQGALEPQDFFLAKRTEMQQRHARFHNTPYALEPNCKESPGGLRDVQLLLWLARAAQIGHEWSEIVRTDWLTTNEYRALRRAELAFKRLRIELHLIASRREDRVLFDLQPQLAQIYGFKPQPPRRASELLMQRYYWAARVVCQVNRLLMQALEEQLFPQPQAQSIPIDDELFERRNRLALVRADGFERNPALLLRVFLVMQQRPGLEGMSAQTLRALWHARGRIDKQFRDNPVNRHTFIQILQQPRGIVHALREMTMWNILPRYLPVFRRIVGQMQHDLFHAYTVDQHILMVIRNLRRFTMPEHAQEFSLASQLIAELEDHWLLYVAALFHDIAKGRGGDHSILGARDVGRFAMRHGLSDAQTRLLEFLVREHLTMSLVAQKQDLSDPAVIQAFARKVGSQRTLAALYLLTVADIRGTSPRVWNAWKGRLLEDLYHQARAALGDANADTGTLLAQRRAQAAARVRQLGLSDAQRTSFWSQLDVAYFLRHEAGEIAWHTLHLHDRLEQSLPVVRARTLGKNEALQVLVYAPDRADLFMAICLYFEAQGLSIQDARIHTTRQGWALDSFVVLLPDHDKDYPAHAWRVERDLHAALNQPADASARPSLARMAHRASRRARVFPVVPSVKLEADTASAQWRLSISCADRVGLLHDLAVVFVHHDADLKMAKIMTLGDRVEDVFILHGANLSHPRRQMRFERDILNALTTDD